MNRFIVDGFNLVYRSYYAFMQLSTSTGTNSGGLYGFFTTLKTLKKKYPDFKFFVVWDNEAKKKKEIFSAYKANRVSNRVDVLPIESLKQALSCLDVAQVECPDEEADDVIASLVQYNDGKDYIYSSDKDLLQLVKDGHIIVISPKVGSIPEKIYDEEAVKTKWSVTPENLACFFALRGDNSDNIPGVCRVPSKILAILAMKYNHPLKIYSHLEEEVLTDYQRKSILEARDQVFINYSLILLKKDLNCVITSGKSDELKLAEILKKYEIKAFSAQTIVELFDSNTAFLVRNSPCLKTVSFFEE